MEVRLLPTRSGRRRSFAHGTCMTLTRAQRIDYAATGMTTTMIETTSKVVSMRSRGVSGSGDAPFDLAREGKRRRATTSRLKVRPSADRHRQGRVGTALPSQCDSIDRLAILNQRESVHIL
jgi:hypothetical protein